MNRKSIPLARRRALAAAVVMLVGAAPAQAFDLSWLELTFTEPTGTALATDSIEVYLTLSLSADATEGLNFDSNAGAPFGVPDLLPATGQAPGGDTQVPFAAYDSAYFNTWLGCGSSFSDGNCPSDTTTYGFQWASAPETLSLAPGESYTYLMGHYTPNGGAAPAGTYELSYVAPALFFNGTDADGNFISADVTLASASSAAPFTRVVSAVPEPTTYALLLAGLGLVAGVARRRR